MLGRRGPHARAGRARNAQLHRSRHRRRQDRSQLGSVSGWPSMACSRPWTTGHAGDALPRALLRDPAPPSLTASGRRWRPPRACSANFVVAQAPDRAIDLEAAPDARRTAAAAGRTWCTPTISSIRASSASWSRSANGGRTRTAAGRMQHCSKPQAPVASATWRSRCGTTKTTRTAFAATSTPRTPKKALHHRHLGHHGPRRAEPAADRWPAVRAPATTATRCRTRR